MCPYYAREVGASRLECQRSFSGEFALKQTRDLPSIRREDPSISCGAMENIRPEVTKFMAACERLFGFTLENGRLSPEECDILEYYAKELRNQIAPLCTDPKGACPDPAVVPPSL